MNDSTYTVTTPHTAACSCGAFTFRSSGRPLLQLVCHCTQCREVAGTPSTALVFFKAETCETSGATRTHRFTADSGHATTRETCAACGEMVLDRTEGFPHLLGVVAERLRAPFSFEPRCHVWTRNKLPEAEIPAGMRAYPGGLE